MSSEEEELSLEAVHAKAMKQYEALVVHQSQTGDEVVSEAIAVMESCSQRARAASLYSKNEELEELQTGTLKFLLLDYYLAKLHGQFLRLESRRSHLHIARELHLEYLERCRELGVLHEDEARQLEGILGDDDEDDEGEEGGEGQGGKKSCGRRAGSKAISADEQRGLKIARFKRIREAQQQMESLRLLLSSEAAEEGEQTPSGTFDREDQARELALLQLQNCARDSLDELPLVAQELTMLAHMETLRRLHETAPSSSSSSSAAAAAGAEAERGRSSGGGPDAQARQDNRQALPGRASSPPRDGPGIQITRTQRVGDEIVLTRETVKASVFTPRMEGPSMTLEEFGDLEVQRAMARGEAEAAARANQATDFTRRYQQLVDAGDEDDAEMVERAAVNDREWDAWKEENPRGSGNKMGKRF